jgi:hypothetical protein
VRSGSVVFHCDDYPTEEMLTAQRQWIDHVFPLFAGPVIIRQLRKGGWSTRWPLDMDPDADPLVAFT